MSTGPAEVLETIRQPEYTGENRCMPCTIINAAIAIVLAIGLAVLVPVGPLGSAAAGTAVLVVAAAAISLRGYLVPGTPWLTRTYFPDWVQRYFEHGEPPEPDFDIEPLDILAAADAVTECEGVDDICLTQEFRTAWYARMDDLRGTDTSVEVLASMLDHPVDKLSFEEQGGAYVALIETADGSGSWRVGQWESDGAYLADMAGAGMLEKRVPDWEALSAPARGRVLNGLRVFLDECPSCGGAVALGEETVESCCRSKEVTAVTCEDCGDRLFEAEQPAAG